MYFCCAFVLSPPSPKSNCCKLFSYLSFLPRPLTFFLFPSPNFWIHLCDPGILRTSYLRPHVEQCHHPGPLDTADFYAHTQEPCLAGTPTYFKAELLPSTDMGASGKLTLVLWRGRPGASSERCFLCSFVFCRFQYSRVCLSRQNNFTG